MLGTLNYEMELSWFGDMAVFSENSINHARNDSHFIRIKSDMALNYLKLLKTGYLLISG